MSDHQPTPGESVLDIIEPVPAEISAAISEGIAAVNAAQEIARENFAIVLRGKDGLAGGVTASVSFGVLFINNIWVCEEQRSGGIGRNLMSAAEAEGRRRGVETACVDTLSTQAPGFYGRLGYEEMARVSGVANGRTIDRIWFRKML